jgi:hypothetical protein
MCKKLHIDELIEMGGHVELTGPLMVFIAAKGYEPVNETEYEPTTPFAIVWLAEKSQIQILARKENGIFGVVTQPAKPKGSMGGTVDYTETPHLLKDFTVEDITIEEVKGYRFIASLLELEAAMAPKRGK